MKERLKVLLENSYSPYSNYKVSAICVMNDGEQFGGVNVENASFGATICAERVAITNAISHGYKKGDFRSLHVMVNSDKVGFPCFVCRQVITEFFNENALIELYYLNGLETYSVGTICPFPFNEDNL